MYNNHPRALKNQNVGHGGSKRKQVFMSVVLNNLLLFKCEWDWEEGSVMWVYLWQITVCHVHKLHHIKKKVSQPVVSYIKEDLLCIPDVLFIHYSFSVLSSDCHQSIHYHHVKQIYQKNNINSAHKWPNVSNGNDS